MKTISSLALFLFLFLNTLPGSALAVPKAPEPDRAGKARIVENYGKLPLSFEENRGQTDEKVGFLSRGGGYTLFLTPDEAVLALSSPSEDEGLGERQKDALQVSRPEKQKSAKGAVIRMKFYGANTAPVITGQERLPETSNYFIGNDPSKWRTHISKYAKVRYREVYPGIDVVFYGNQRRLEYDFVVSPGSDPSKIKLEFQGAEEISLDEKGNLVLRLKDGEVIQHAPVIYQEVNGRRVDVAGGYWIDNKGRVGCRVASWDRQRPLVIDPVLVYSTYLGGSYNDRGYGIAVDGSGNAYVTGWTSSSDFPTVNALYPDLWGIFDAFIFKLSADGSQAVYSTYLGGSACDLGHGIAVDGSGNAYVTGWTSSSDFPTVNALYPDQAGEDAFIFKLSADGSQAVYSTYLGGNAHDDCGLGIAVDGSGNAYVTGGTSSSDFPTVNALYPDQAGGDAFIFKLSADGSQAVYSTYLGGNAYDLGHGIAVDGSGNAYVTGWTYSSDFPTVNALYPNLWGDHDAFIAKISDNPAPEWTFFVYLGADNNLSPFANGDLNEMQQVGSDSNVNIVTLVDQDGDHDTHFYKVEHGSLTETALSEINPGWINEVDMSDPNTLITSANYVINKYPAKRYCIVLWNHGDGWRKTPEKLIYRQVIEDKGNMMRMDDVGYALGEIKAHLGSKIDLVGFDACLMGMVEVAYEIRNHAEAIVGSEDLVGGEGWPYDAILEDLVNDAIMDSETFAGKIVDIYAEWYDGTSYWTLSALRLNMAHGLAILIDNFANSMTSNWDEIRLARSNSQEFAFWYITDFHEHIDLYDFCSELNTAEAQAVMGKVDDMVINERHGSGLPDSHGLAIYFPANGEDYDSEYHASPDHQIMFPVDTSWDEFLARYYGEPIPDIKANGSDGPLFITPSESVDISISLDPGNMVGEGADWWCVADAPFGWYYYVDTGTWLPGFEVSYQGPLFTLTPPLGVLNTSDLPIGSYTFYFGVDGNRNGNLDEPLYYDSVEVNITP